MHPREYVPKAPGLPLNLYITGLTAHIRSHVVTILSLLLFECLFDRDLSLQAFYEYQYQMSQQDSSIHPPSIPVPFDLSFPPFDLVLCSPPDYQGPPALPPHLSLQLSNSSPSSEGSDTLGTPPNEPMYPHVPNGKRPASISNNDARKKVRNNGFPEEQSPSTDEDEVKAKSARGSRFVFCSFLFIV